LDVRLTRTDLKGLKIRVRQGYYAPYRPTATTAGRK